MKKLFLILYIDVSSSTQNMQIFHKMKVGFLLEEMFYIRIRFVYTRSLLSMFTLFFGSYNIKQKNNKLLMNIC